jgi:plastocyanin
MVKARWIRLVAGLFVLALLVAACSSDDNGGGTTASTGGSTAATGATAETGGGGGGGGTTITIANFAFDPSSLTLSGATDVTVTNNDSAAHTFTADDGSFDVQLDPGATETVNIAASTDFHCSIHPQMTGSVTVG